MIHSEINFQKWKSEFKPIDNKYDLSLHIPIGQTILVQHFPWKSASEFQYFWSAFLFVCSLIWGTEAEPRWYQWSQVNVLSLNFFNTYLQHYSGPGTVEFTQVRYIHSCLGWWKHLSVSLSCYSGSQITAEYHVSVDMLRGQSSMIEWGKI